MLPSDMKSLHNLPKRSYLQYIRLFPITQTAKVRSYTTLILTLIAIICFSVFAISPTITTIIELRKQLEDSRFANESLRTKIESLDKLQKSYLSMGSTLGIISEAIPTSPEIPTLFAKIQTLAVMNNLEIVSLRSDEVDLTNQVKAKQPTSFLFDVTVSGSYDQTATFLDSLKQFSRVVTLESISISRDQQQNAPLETTIRGRAYYHPEVL